MTAQILAEPSSTLFANAADGWHRRDRLYTGAAIFVALLAVPMLAAAAFDARQIADVGIWVKPLKFVLALTIYLATLAWYGGFLPAAARQSRFYRLHAIAVVAAIAAELAVIAGAGSSRAGCRASASGPSRRGPPGASAFPEEPRTSPTGASSSSPRARSTRSTGSRPRCGKARASRASRGSRSPPRRPRRRGAPSTRSSARDGSREGAS